MKLSPLEWYTELHPAVRQRFDNIPDDMMAILPARRAWLLALACLLASCLNAPTWSAVTPPTTPAPPTVLTTRVAPLFLHGRGCGHSGWDAADCPVLLTKDDAYTVIAEEARAAGLHFTQNATTLYDVLPMPGRAAEESLPTPKRSLTLDGSDTDKKVAFIFVSAGEANNWRKKCGHSSLGESVDIYGCAASLRDILAGAPLDGYYAVFYDPAITLTDLPPASANDHDPQATGDLTSEAREYACAQLRLQVREFIGWLKTRNSALG